MQTTAIGTVTNSLPQNEVILLTLLISGRYISYTDLTNKSSGSYAGRGLFFRGGRRSGRVVEIKCRENLSRRIISLYLQSVSTSYIGCGIGAKRRRIGLFFGAERIGRGFGDWRRGCRHGRDRAAIMLSDNYLTFVAT